jgi:hypothetical protein
MLAINGTGKKGILKCSLSFTAHTFSQRRQHERPESHEVETEV